MMRPLYTVADAAEATGVGKTTIYDLARRHSIGLRTVGGTMIFRASDLRRLKALRGTGVGRPRKATSPRDA